ncbi:metalloregulator ArsR/SmtB family transcription factor [Amycolatopsis sp. NPDC051128]|uniref:ArsR/SmtB family transcription factor n=1 Tax=Amycolatopsis sp. NPDC051128 TaxID=3155412 RepID=UPI0034343420
MARSSRSTPTAGDDSSLDAVFPALANPARRRLLHLLLQGPQSVNSLAEHFDMARPSVSEHLKVLLVSGLVTTRKVGRERLYSLDQAPMRELSEWLHPYEAYWKERMRLLRVVVEEAEED